MALLNRLKSLLEWLQQLLGNGPPENRLIILRKKDLIKELNTLDPLQLKDLLLANKACIVEFLKTDKNVWNDAYNFSYSSLFKIRDTIVSIWEYAFNGHVKSNFWSSDTDRVSQDLLLPSDFAFNNIRSDSWFTIKDWSPKHDNNPQLSVLGTKKEAKKTQKTRNRTKKKQPCNRSRKYRLYMSPETKYKIKQWFGCVRKTYNWALSSIKEKKHPINSRWLRNRFVNSCNIPKEYRYLLDTPKHVREGAIDELVDAFKINFRKGEGFEMKFRSKKNPQSIVIPRDSIKSYQDNTLKLYPTMLPSTIKMYSKSNVSFDYDCRMLMDRLGHVYLSVPYRKEFSEPACDNQAGIVALDPGVRTFMTAYGIKGTNTVIRKIGDRDITRIQRLCIFLDRTVSNYNNKKNRKTYKKRSLKKAEHRLRMRIRNLVKDVHFKTASWLCKTFKNIIIPPFETSQMVKRGSRCIGNRTVRSMLTWAHYGFRQRLVSKAEEMGCKVHVLGEHYTTKTCTSCGFYNPRIKGEKVLTCPCCNVKVDRDVSGARNILLKNTRAA